MCYKLLQGGIYTLNGILCQNIAVQCRWVLGNQLVLLRDVMSRTVNHSCFHVPLTCFVLFTQHFRNIRNGSIGQWFSSMLSPRDVKYRHQHSYVGSIMLKFEWLERISARFYLVDQISRRFLDEMTFIYLNTLHLISLPLSFISLLFQLFMSGKNINVFSTLESLFI